MRSIYYTADVTVYDGSDTTADGDYCGDGNGYTVESGWISPSWSRFSVAEERDSVEPDTYDAGDADIDPNEFDYSPLGWLVKRLNDTLHHIDPHGLTGDAVSGVTLYASDADDDTDGSRAARLAAHVYGYSLAQVERAVYLVNHYDALVAQARDYGITTTLSRVMRGLPAAG